MPHFSLPLCLLLGCDLSRFGQWNISWQGYKWWTKAEWMWWTSCWMIRKAVTECLGQQRWDTCFIWKCFPKIPQWLKYRWLTVLFGAWLQELIRVLRFREGLMGMFISEGRYDLHSKCNHLAQPVKSSLLICRAAKFQRRSNVYREHLGSNGSFM